MPEVYYLPGRTSQFYRVADLGLGATGKLTTHDPPVPFAHADGRSRVVRVRASRHADEATQESTWTYGEEGEVDVECHDQRRSRSQQVPDTPEVIAAKRAARAVKRLKLRRPRLRPFSRLREEGWWTGRILHGRHLSQLFTHFLVPA
jgi:hypothetical protein